jgi:hypothetical protein
MDWRRVSPGAKTLHLGFGMLEPFDAQGELKLRPPSIYEIAYRSRPRARLGDMPVRRRK